jgi:hypothetical protein
MKIAICPYVVNKPTKDAPMDYSYLAYNFQNKDMTQAELRESINAGWALTTWHGGGAECKFDPTTHSPEEVAKHKCAKGHRGQHRIQENFFEAQHFGLDYDKAKDLEKIFSDPFIRDNYSIWYHTASSTPENPRFRILFELESPVTDADLYREMVLALLWKVGAEADPWCKDPCRVFMGPKAATRILLITCFPMLP